jgi:glycosyltransferase involved in cell wall biosynthesis
MMRIAYVCMDRGVPVYGRTGSSIHVQEVVRAFLACGARVELFAASADDDPPLDLAAVATHRIPVLREGPRRARERLALAANRRLRTALERAASFNLVYERYSLWSHAGMAFARDSGTPGVLEVNAPLIEQQAEYRGLVDRAGAERVAARAFGASRVLIALSDEIGAYLNRYPGARGRVEVVPDAVNPDRFPANVKRTWHGALPAWTVGFVGSLKPWHGVTTLIDAFAILHAAHPDTQVLIVGDGPERGRVEAHAAGLGLSDAVHFTGSVAPNQVPGLLASMDAGVAPYPQLSSFYFSPLKVFEYMAAGLPVVVSRIGQLAEVVRDGENGLLCPPGDAAAFAAALCRLKQAPHLGARLGCAARRLVFERYTWDRVVSRILSLAAVGTPLRAPAKLAAIR